MPELLAELENLKLADHHIAAGHVLIDRMRAVVDRQLAAGFSTLESRQALETMEATMQIFLAHRTAILATIDAIRARRIRTG